MTGVHFDTSQVDRLSVDLSEAPKRMKRSAGRTMVWAKTEILREMKDDFSGHRYAPHVPRSLEARKVGELAYEIGELTSSGPQWGLAAILAFGTSNNAPVVDHTASLRRVGARLPDRLANDAEDAVLGGEE